MIYPYKKQEANHMAGSTFGKQFTVTSWGESHGRGVGVVVDGCPAGLPLNEEDIQRCLNRRKPGQSTYTTSRQEKDQVMILSGVFQGMTTGTPISLLVFNEDHHSADYTEIKDVFRPGHGDYTFQEKYGIRDYRGGGRSSGRETIARVAAGAIAEKILATLGITVTAYASEIGPVHADPANFDPSEITRNPFGLPDAQAVPAAQEYVTTCMEQKNSAGGIVECMVTGLPVGLGEPVFDKLDACLGRALFSIGAVKGVEVGDGFAAAKATGLTNNDEFYTDGKQVFKKTNHAGGILGGMSDGSPLIVRAAFKPTPSIFSPQKTVNQNLENVTISIHGRHDPLIVPRAVVVVESMTAITLVDLLLQNMCCQMDYVQKIYGKPASDEPTGC
jgi:chorismate synthase